MILLPQIPTDKAAFLTQINTDEEKSIIANKLAVIKKEYEDGKITEQEYLNKKISLL